MACVSTQSPTPWRLKARDFLRGWMAKNIHSMEGKSTLTMVHENIITIISQDVPYWYAAGMKEKAEKTYPEAKFVIEERP